MGYKVLAAGFSGRQNAEMPAPAPAAGVSVRVGLYIRVSSVDLDPDQQFNDLRKFCRERRWKAVGEFVDHGMDCARPGLRELLNACRVRTVNAILVWKLDRLARSLRELVRLTREFETLGVNLISLRNPGMDTTTPQGKFFLGSFGLLYETERDWSIERTRAGIAAAKARGVKFGRPRCAIDADHVWNLRNLGLSNRQIARSLGVNHHTVISLLEDRRKCERRG